MHEVTMLRSFAEFVISKVLLAVEQVYSWS